MVTDPIGDMLTRIRNGLHARKSAILCPSSKFRIAVLQVLQGEGYIRGYSESVDDKGHPLLSIELKYDKGEPAIREVHRVSKPGRRVYAKIKDLQPHYNGLGISILSTPAGVMADHAARAANVGGEVVCRVF